MKTISLLCPTRARRALFQRMMDSVIENSANLSAVEIVTYIDEDDLESQKIEFHQVQGKKIIKPRAPMGICNELCFKNSVGEIIILMNDDVVIRTPGWDELLRAAVSNFPDEIYLMYPNDLFKKGKLGTFPILSRKTCELLVEPFPAQYKGNFIDTHLFDIFQRLKKQNHHRVQYLEDIVFEHMHYRLGKGSFDITYQSRRRFGDDIQFVSLSKQRDLAATSLIQSIRKGKNVFCPLEKNPIEIKSFFSALKMYLKIFAFNSKLPLRWRMSLFSQFLARYWAEKFL